MEQIYIFQLNEILVFRITWLHIYTSEIDEMTIRLINAVIVVQYDDYYVTRGW